jgi:hypothetical protein
MGLVSRLPQCLPIRRMAHSDPQPTLPPRQSVRERVPPLRHHPTKVGRAGIRQGTVTRGVGQPQAALLLAHLRARSGGVSKRSTLCRRAEGMPGNQKAGASLAPASPGAAVVDDPIYFVRAFARLPQDWPIGSL